MRQSFLTLLLITGCLAIERRRFMPRSNAQISQARNFYLEELPCHDDILSFQNNDKVVAFLDKPLDVSEIWFPDVGVLYLDSDAEIGGTDGTDWQCGKKENVSVVSFSEYVSDQDVYDPITWEEMEIRNAPPSFELHMNRVPGAADAVEIFERNPIHFKLFNDFAVREWKDFQREMTTDGFMERLRTLEGQLTIQLGPRMTKEYDTDGIALMRPIGEPIRVGEFEGSYNEAHLGTRNPNLDNQTMAAICAHVHCENEEERVPPRCISTFTPKGHCCPVCGAQFELQTYQKTLGDLELFLDHFRLEYKKKNNKALAEFYHVSYERVDESDFELRYQIVLIVKDNQTVLDEDRLYATTMLFLTTLGEYWHPTEGFQLVEFKESARDHSYETSSIILGIVFFCISAVIATFYFSVDARNQTRFLYRRGRAALEGLRAGSVPAEVEMADRSGGGEQMVSLADLSSECESGGDAANPTYFANRAFSLASLDKECAKEGNLVDLEQIEPSSEPENEPAKDVDAEGMSCVDLL